MRIQAKRLTKKRRLTARKNSKANIGRVTRHAAIVDELLSSAATAAANWAHFDAVGWDEV